MLLLVKILPKEVMRKQQSKLECFLVELMKYVPFFKDLTRLFILIHATMKENSRVMKLFDKLDFECGIVFNKFDIVDAEEQIHSVVEKWARFTLRVQIIRKCSIIGLFFFIKVNSIPYALLFPSSYAFQTS
jgi:GTP-binding protein EngB required for normal cell division